MTDRIQTDSGYGLFGEARYQSDEAAWKAQRRLDAPSASVALVPDEHNPEEDDASTLTDVLTEPGRSAAVEEIIGCEPTLQPARGLIANLLAESPPHDDLDNDGVGELMAVVFTSAKERRHRRVKPEDAGDPFFRKQPILVVSKERNILEFIAPTKSSIAFQQDGEASSEGYELSGAERLQYVTEDGPIQQVTRPELFTNLDAPSIVGVRTASAILIFQPVFRKVKLPAGTHRGPKVTAEASLQPNLINRINLDPRLGACRGHIALNPWDDGQLAYVADDGSWTVWSLRNKGGTPISQSRLNPHTNNRISSDNRSGYRIIWILDAYHVLVSSTDAVQVFDLMGRLVGRWSLDVRAFGSFMISTKPSSWDPATIMLFTTSHVLLLSVTIGKALSIECAMAWRHNLSSSQALYGIHCLSSYNGRCSSVSLT